MGVEAAATHKAPAAAQRSVLWRRAARHGAIVGGGIWVLAKAFGYVGPFTDAHAYWVTDLGALYAVPVGGVDSFPYSPVLAQIIVPFTVLPWPVFAAAWAAFLFGVLVWLSGRWLPLAIVAPPVAFELYAGNLHILIGAAIVLGWRHPAAWAYVLLAKVTPGIGLLWFLVRREWRPMFLALGATAAIAAVSFAISPNLWFEWGDYLTTSSHPAQPTALPIPLALRILPAAALVVWGARTNRPWTVPAAAMLALPVLWVGSATMLLALLARPGTRHGVERRGHQRVVTYVGPERRARLTAQAA
jgi:hypothetical protein